MCSTFGREAGRMPLQGRAAGEGQGQGQGEEARVQYIWAWGWATVTGIPSEGQLAIGEVGGAAGGRGPGAALVALRHARHKAGAGCACIRHGLAGADEEGGVLLEKRGDGLPRSPGGASSLPYH